MIAILLALLLMQPPPVAPPVEQPSAPSTPPPGHTGPPVVPPGGPPPPGKPPQSPTPPDTPMANPPAHGQGGKPGGPPPKNPPPGKPIDPGPPCEKPPCTPDQRSVGPVSEPVLAQPAPTYPQQSPPALSELQQLQLENHALRVRLAQLEQQLTTAALSQQRTALEAGITASHPGWRMDWQTGQLVPATTTPAAAPPQ